MKKYLQLFAAALLITGCAGMPGPVEDKYLVEKTDNEATVIKDIEQKIIVKNKEKQVVENRLKEITPAPGLTEDELKLLKKENGLLKDQVDFYTKTKDAVNLESRKAALKENENLISRKTAQYNFQLAEKEMTEAELDVKSSELAVEIARLNYEKSRIASVYRDRHEESPEGESGNFITRLFSRKDPADKYGYKKYDEYMKKQQDELSMSAIKLKDAEKKFQDAKSKLSDSAQQTDGK